MNTLNKDLAAVQLAQVIEQLEDLLFCDLVMTYNDYASYNGYEMIYDNDEQTINEIYTNAYDAVRVTNHKGYNDNDDYFTYGGYGLMSSFSYQLIQDDNCPIDISELAQWLIDEDKLAGYGITVTTLDDMLDSINDYITDDKHMLNKLCDYLSFSYNDSRDIENLVGDCMYELEGDVTDNIQDTYERLINVINHLGINYE